MNKEKRNRNTFIHCHKNKYTNNNDKIKHYNT